LSDQLAIAQLVALLTRPTIVLTTVLAMGSFFTWQAFASFFPTFLVEFADVTTTRASLVFGAVFAVTLVGAPALGRLSDAVGRDGVLAGSFSVGAVGFAVFLLGDGLATVVAGTLLVGVGLSWTGVLNTRFMDHLAEDERGTGFGLVRTLVLLVSSLGSVVTGTLAEQAGWLPAYGFVAGLLGLLVVLLVLVRARGLAV
jgi:MFS family permease